MSVTAHLLNKDFIDQTTSDQILSKIKESDWVPTIPKGAYASDHWRVIKLINEGKKTNEWCRFPEIQKLSKYFKCKIVNLVLYSILPGGKLHPHRDMSGTLELGRLRFHIPLRTDPKVDFFVAGKNNHMSEHELWALNTSYKHAVENRSNIDRVHIVLMVEANKWCWSLLPKPDFKYYIHCLGFYYLIAWTGIKTIAEPKKLWGRIRLVKFLGQLIFRKLTS